MTLSIALTVFLYFKFISFTVELIIWPSVCPPFSNSTPFFHLSLFLCFDQKCRGQEGGNGGVKGVELPWEAAEKRAGTSLFQRLRVAQRTKMSPQDTQVQGAGREDQPSLQGARPSQLC